MYRSATLVTLCLVSFGCGQFGFEATDSGPDGSRADAASGFDAGADVRSVGDVGPTMDAGADAPVDASSDARTDAVIVVPTDAGPDALVDAGPDAPVDAGPDAPDAGPVCPVSGLRAWYRLDEVAGPVLDSSGCGLHGTAVGVTRGELGVVGASVRWNDSGSIHVPTFFMTAAEWPDYTLEAWISYNDSRLAAIAAASDGMGGDPFIFGIFTADEVTVSLPGGACGGMSTYTDGSGAVVVRSRWTHVAVSVSPTTGAIRYFVDGRQTGTDTGAPLFCESPDGLYLGTLGTSTGWTLNGQLDDIKIWNVPRSEDDVCRDAGGVVAGAVCDLSAVRP